MITVRYFAAARAAAGADEERYEPPLRVDGHAPSSYTLASLLGAVLERPRAAEASVPDLARVLSRSSFLVNGVATKDHSRPLSPGDTVDVLPPFAGG